MARRRAEYPVADDHDAIVGRYAERLSESAVLPWIGSRWEPVTIGPTWKVGPDGHWILPELTIGWDVLGWSGTWLQYEPGRPWEYTLEQARFLLWWFALDEQGRFLFRDGVLQRLKGWGKDPIGACILAVEAFGPCRFGGWHEDRPIAVDNPQAWAQTAATSLAQTKNTMRLFPTLFTREARLAFGLQIGKTIVHGLDDQRMIEAVTSAPATLEGARSSVVLMNETQHWTASNGGHDMADVIERNTTKSPDGAARTLAITNAYEPSEDSTAQRTREAWEAEQAGDTLMTGLLYDSLEAAPAAPLNADAAPTVVAGIRGDSKWVDVERVMGSILDLRNPPSRSRRWWYNQVTAVEDAWVSPQEWDAGAGTLEVPDGAIVTLGFDGSKSDDHTALVGSLVDADHLFLIEAWVPGKDGIDRRAVDQVVHDAIGRYDVVGFYGDVKEFESYIDDWGQEFGPGLIVKASQRNPVAWDMRPREKEFTLAAERTHAAILESAKRAAEGIEGPRLTHDGSARFRWYALNARRNPNRWGISVRKEHRGAERKIDAVPAAILARLARMDYLALPESKRQRKVRSGKVW